MPIGVKATFVQLIPVIPGIVPNGSLFLDSSNGNASTIKDTSGGTTVINSAEAATNLVTKVMQASAPIAANKPVSKRPDGKIEIADSNAPNGKAVIGITREAAVSADDLIAVLCVGANMVDAISGLGFTVGQELYVSDTGGYTNDPSTLSGTDAIIKIGVADCSAGGASSIARDLILFPDVVSG